MSVTLIAALMLAEELEEENEILTRRTLRDSIDPFAVSTEDFGKLFRLPQEGVIYLTEVLKPLMKQPTRSTGIPVHLRILCTLNSFACGGYQRRVGGDYLHAMSQAEVSRSIKMVSDAIGTHLLSSWVNFPNTQLEIQNSKDRFLEKTGFPGALGAMDATQIAIATPHRSRQHLFLNSNGYHSKNVQIVADSDLKILSINARYGGKTPNSHIWRTSKLCCHMQQIFQKGDQSSWLVGNSCYPLQPWLMTPFRSPPSISPEYSFNASHSKVLSYVKRCIGVWKSWFRCLKNDRALHYTPERAGILINVCAVLHNMALHYKVPLPEILEEKMDVVEMDDLNPPKEGLEIRSKIIAQHFS